MNLIKKIRNLLLSVVCACSALCGTYKTGTLKGTLNNKYAEKTKIDYGYRTVNTTLTFSGLNDKQLTKVSSIDDFVTNRSSLTEKMQNSSGGFDTSTNFSTLSIQRAYKICDLYNDYDSIINTSYSSYGFFPFYYSFCVTGAYTSSGVTYSTDNTSGSYESKSYPYCAIGVYDCVSKTITSTLFSFQYTTLSTGGLTNNISFFSSGQQLSLYIFFMSLIGSSKFNISCFFSPMENVSQNEYSNINVGGDTSELESQIASLKAQVETLTASNSELTNSLNTLQESYNTLLTNYSNLQSENSDLKSQIETLNNTISDLEKSIADLKAQIVSLNLKIKDYESVLSNLSNAVLNLTDFYTSCVNIVVSYRSGVNYLTKTFVNPFGSGEIDLYTLTSQINSGYTLGNPCYIDSGNYIYAIDFVLMNSDSNFIVSYGDNLKCSLISNYNSFASTNFCYYFSNIVNNQIDDLTFSYDVYKDILLNNTFYANYDVGLFTLQSADTLANSKNYALPFKSITYNSNNIGLEYYKMGYGDGYDNMKAKYDALQETYIETQTDLNYYYEEYNKALNRIDELNDIIANQSDYTFSNLFWGLAQTPFGVLTSIFNVDVMGVNIGGLITGLLTACIVIWLIHRFI